MSKSLHLLGCVLQGLCWRKAWGGILMQHPPWR